MKTAKMITNFWCLFLFFCSAASFSNNFFTVAFPLKKERFTYGTVLYRRSDALNERQWTEADVIDLLYRIAVDVLVPADTAAIAVDPDAFLRYYELVQQQLNLTIVSAANRKRATVAVADAIGSYLHAVALPRIRVLYYRGKLSYDKAKRMHDLIQKIK